MDKTTTLPTANLSDTRMDEFWDNLDPGLTQPKPAPRDLDVGLSDLTRATGAGGLELVGGIGELARQAANFGRTQGGKEQGDYLENARANMAAKLAPALDVVGDLGDLAQSGADNLKGGMSADAKEAMSRSLVAETPQGRLELGDGAGDIDVWAMKMAQGVGSLLPTLLSGGVTGVAARATVGRMVTSSMLKKGASQEVAEAVAAKTVARLATGAATMTGVTGSVGAAGVNARDSVLGMSFDALSNSTTFREAFRRIDGDQQLAHLSDSDKLAMAREETANLASQATMGDAKTWGAAAVGTLMGDTMLFKMLAGKGAGAGVLKGMAKGAAGEGISEALEEGTQQYSVNEALNEVAGANIDPMKGVVSSAVEGGLIGAGVGGATGGGSGLRGERAQPQSGEQDQPVTQEQDLAGQVEPVAADEIITETQQQESPLGPSASQFDELRDVPAYLRQDGTAERFKGFAEDSEVQRALAGEFGQSVQELVAAQMRGGVQGKSLYERALAGELGTDPFTGNKSALQVAVESQRLKLPLKDVIFAGDASAKPKGAEVAAPGDHDDRQAGTGPQFRGAERTRWQSGQEGDLLPPERDLLRHVDEALPGATIEGEGREVGSELPFRDFITAEDGRPAQRRAADIERRGRELADQPAQIGQSDTIFAGGAPGSDQRNGAYTPPRLSRDQVDRSLGEQSTRDPRSPVARAIEQAGGEHDSIFGPLKSLRITRKGKPFATEKEAALASRKGQETPVPLNGGGFGVAAIEEVEQAKGVMADNSEEQSHEQIAGVDPVGSKGEGDQQPAGAPVSAVAGAEPDTADALPAPAREHSPAPDAARDESLPDDDALTPAPAGVAVSGNLTEAELRDRDLLTERNGRWKYRSSVGAGWFTADSKESAIGMAQKAYQQAVEKGDPVPTRAERWDQEEQEFVERMDRNLGRLTTPELEARYQKLGGTIADLRRAGRNEMNGNGGRRTGAAVANEGARQVGQEKMELERYIQLRHEQEAIQGGGAHADQGNNASAWSGKKSADEYREAQQRLFSGEMDFAEFQAMSRSALDNAPSLRTELEKKTKQDLLDQMSRFNAARYKNDKKAVVVEAAYNQLLGDLRWAANGDSNTMSETYAIGAARQSIEERVAKALDGLTPERYQQFRDKQLADMAESQRRREALKQALTDPQSLEDFQAFIERRGLDKLTTEQRARYEDMIAARNLDRRDQSREAKAEARVVPTASGDIIKTTHTKSGADLFVVQMGDRVERDAYNRINAHAKRLGGWYSSFRGKGAVPGFQFKEKGKAAEFRAWLGGQGESAPHQAVAADPTEVVEAQPVEGKVKQVEALRSRAASARAKAEAVLNAERKENTARRAGMAANARANAERDLRFAGLLEAIATGIEGGEITYLRNLANGAQLEELQTAFNRGLWSLSAARHDALVSEGVITRDDSGRYSWSDKATPEQMVEGVSMPGMDYYTDRLREVAIKMQGASGYKQAGAKIMSLVKAATNRDSKTTTLSDPELIAKLKAYVSGSEDYSTSTIKDQIAGYGRLERMGITNHTELRAALRELVRLQRGLNEKVPQRDPVAEKTRALKLRLLNNRNAFIDFFPTTEDHSADLAARLGIEPGMLVLEPSAGHGMLAEAAREAGATVEAVELAADLREILAAKGFSLVGDDFMATQPTQRYDAVIMNPPFSNDMDIDHVRHAFEHLKPGGRLAAIVSSMAGRRSNKKNQAFREWLDSLGASEEMMPEGAFKDSLNPTNVRTKILLIEKPAQKVAAPAIGSGARSTVFTPKGKAIEVQYRLMEAADLMASHDFDGTPNGAYPQELQPRDRSKGTYQVQVRQIANNPEGPRLSGSPETDRGAPIVRDGIVESGNGRTIGLKQAYRQGTADEYRAYLLANAGEFGFTADEVGGMDQPILVRERLTEMDPAARREFVVDSNTDAKMANSASEDARADAGKLDDRLMGLLNIPEGGDLLALSNEPFLNAFARAIGENSLNQYKDDRGRWNDAYRRRVSAAIFAYGYDSATLLKAATGDSDEVGKNMLSALMNNAGKMAELRSMAPDHAVDLANILAEAVTVMSDARRNRQAIAEIVNQGDMVSGGVSHAGGAMAEMLADASRSAKRLTETIGAVLDMLNHAAMRAGQVDLLTGEPADTISTEEAIHAQARQFRARKELEQSAPRPGRDLFGVAGPRNDHGKDAGVSGSAGRSQAQDGSEKLTVEGVRFSKQSQAKGDARPTRPLTRKEAEMVTNGWLKQYQGMDGIDIHIHATQAEMERALGLPPVDGLIRRAAFDRTVDALHVAADTIANPRHLREILRHEVLAHYGLAKVLGGVHYTRLLSRVMGSRNDASMKGVWEWVQTHYADEPVMVQAEEVIAHLAELEPSAWRRGWDRVVSWVTRALRTVGFVSDGVTAAEIRSMIEAMGKQLEKGSGSESNEIGGQRFSAERTPWKPGFPEVILHGRLGDATAHPDYEAAKGGDDAAARRLVSDVLSRDAVRRLKELIGDREAIALGVHAEEAVSRNAIPQAMADVLGKLLGVEVDIDIVQAAKVGRTAQDGFGRLANQPSFDGQVRADKPYLIMDDTLTQGGTLANLKGYIEARGGEVLAATALTGKQYSAKIAIDSSTLEQLRDQYDGTGLEAWWQNRFGYGFDSLTESEARYLLRAKDADKIRDRVTAAGQASPARSEHESDRDDGSLPPGGLKFSQSFGADDALQKLNLGRKPDIIDRAHERLDTLRGTDRATVKGWVDRFIQKANTEVLDALAPIKYAEDAAGVTDASESGYVAARMASGAASTMQATMLYGLPEWKDGVIQRKAGTGEADALLGIFEGLGKDLHNWLGWMAGHRAEILMAEGRENLLTAQDIAALKALDKGKEAQFLDAKHRWNALNAATLDLAQEAGLFTAEERAKWESEWYIPFFREGEGGDALAPFKAKGVANQSAGIKKLKGGTAHTADLLENIFTSTSKLIDASMKNMAAQKTVWNLADTGIIEVVAKPNMMDWRALQKGRELITVKLEGEDYLIRVNDPDLYRAMTFFDRQPHGKLVQIAAGAKRLLTAGVTASPEFMLRNFLRDSLSSWAISKDGFKPVIDSIKGVKKTLTMDGSTIDVMFSGASFLGGYVNGNDPKAMADSVRKALRRKGMTPEQIERYERSLIRNAKQAKEVLGKAWDQYSKYGEALENANREAVYEAAIKAGKSHAQAAFESRDLMDFSMLGASRVMQTLVMVLPFFNARVQGLGKLARELRDNPRAIAKRAGMITAASLALLAMNWDDERYEELPDWDKDANWHMWLGDQHFRIPKPFEIGVMFGTIPERMVRAMGDKDTGAQFGKAVARAVGETFALNPIPQIVKPMSEAYFNYDPFRGGPIENFADQSVMPQARYSEQTSLLMRELGQLTGMSPKKLEHIVVGYTGTLGGYVLSAADGLIRASRPGESAALRADEIPLIKAVYRGSGPAKSTQHMDQFYRMLSEVNELKRTVDQYRKEGMGDEAKALLDEQGGILKARRSLSQTQTQVRQLRNRLELIQRDQTLSADEKRSRIDAILAKRNDLVYRAVERTRGLWQ
ncbi:LPD38 domain-containing protein [Aeromonas diversa]|uniref:LPD38 domain-containing protein n=1 Tax=Aeromonas diversa TaxID=502790 RepID=UPI0039A1A2B4